MAYKMAAASLRHYTFFFGSQTRRRIFTLDGSNEADSRMNVPFGGFVDIVPHFGDK